MHAEKKVDNRPPVAVIATARGYHDGKIFEVGDTFKVPASMFDTRVRMTKGAIGPAVEDGEYPAPQWFEEAVTETETVTKTTAKSKSANDIG